MARCAATSAARAWSAASPSRLPRLDVPPPLPVPRRRRCSPPVPTPSSDILSAFEAFRARPLVAPVDDAALLRRGVHLALPRLALLAHPGTDVARVLHDDGENLDAFFGTTHGFLMSSSCSASLIQSPLSHRDDHILLHMVVHRGEPRAHALTRPNSDSSLLPSARSSSASVAREHLWRVHSCHPLFATSVRPQDAPTYLNSFLVVAMGTLRSRQPWASSHFKSAMLRNLERSERAVRDVDVEHAVVPKLLQQTVVHAARPPCPVGPCWVPSTCGRRVRPRRAALPRELRGAVFFAASAAASAASALITTSGTKLTGLLSSKGTLASIRSRSSSADGDQVPRHPQPRLVRQHPECRLHAPRAATRTPSPFLSIAAPRVAKHVADVLHRVALPRIREVGVDQVPGVLKSHGMSAPSCAWCWSVPHSLCVALPCRMNRNSLRWPFFPKLC